MTERVEHQSIPDRLFCPNCTADYPAPRSRRYIDCRRCGTGFLAPDEARESVSDPESLHEVVESESTETPSSGERVRRYLRTVRTSTPSLALGFNAAAFSLWFVGIVSFEIAVMTILLVTSGVVVQDP